MPRQKQTTCKNGHDLTDPTNVYTYPQTGHRICKQCRKVIDRNTKERRQMKDGKKNPVTLKSMTETQLTPEQHKRLAAIKEAANAFINAILDNTRPSGLTGDAIELARRAKYSACLTLYNE